MSPRTPPGFRSRRFAATPARSQAGGPLGLGLDTGQGGALRQADSRLSTTLHTLGWMRRGELWESVAIPEIRAQAAALARDLR